jgi:hypothetical protein
MFNIKDMVKNKKVTFVRFKKDELIYSTECGFEFPVPITDTGEATFLASDKAITYMRWIRKHATFIEKSKNNT